MESTTHLPKVSKTRVWTGYVLSAIPVLMLLFSGVMKLVKPPGFAEGMVALGWDEKSALTLAILEIGSTILYLIPRTAVLGVILLTGYFGGAVATHVRIGDPTFVAALALGILIWLGLYLREPRLHSLVPFRK